MKSRIFLYLFIFSILFILFQYMNQKKIFESNEKRIESLQLANSLNENLLSQKTVTIDSLRQVNAEFFDIQNDEYALMYLEDEGYNALQLSILIEDQLIDQNKANGDNPIVPYSGMDGHMRINKVRVVNHKWGLADFTDGTYWGQLLFVFQVNKDATIDFEVKESFLYPKQE